MSYSRPHKMSSGISKSFFSFTKDERVGWARNGISIESVTTSPHKCNGQQHPGKQSDVLNSIEKADSFHLYVHATFPLIRINRWFKKITPLKRCSHTAWNVKWVESSANKCETIFFWHMHETAVHKLYAIQNSILPTPLLSSLSPTSKILVEWWWGTGFGKFVIFL